MEAKELMIGDWVYINPWDEQEPHHPNRVTGVQYNSWRGDDYCDWVDCEDWDEISFNDIRPIPLTDEILEKNGFYWGYPVDVEEMASNVFGGLGIEMPPKSWVWDEGGGVVSVIFPNEIDGGMITCYLDKHLTLVFDDIFVHELQHALRLCGIEKEIKL